MRSKPTLVKDFRGDLIPRENARKIDGQWYEEGKTCILMEDNQWYRTTSTNKIIYDWEKKVYVLVKNAGNLCEGLVDDGSIGKFTPSTDNVSIAYKKPAFVRSLYYDPLNPNSAPVQEMETTTAWKRNQYFARTSEVAERYGYKESLYDGCFYKLIDCDSSDLEKMKTHSIPHGEKSNTYSMEDDQAGKAKLLSEYASSNPSIEAGIRNLAKYIPFTFGIEFETSNGFIPKRLRGKLGVRPLRDGSIGGIEFTTIPLSGAKGLQTIKLLGKELCNRTTIDNKCSLHVHFGNVRRDKLYILSLWNTLSRIEKEFFSYFPYSRTNSIRPDGKVYCKALPNIGLNIETLNKAANKQEFENALYTEFNKIYCFLNNEKPLGKEYDRKREKSIKQTEDGLKWRFEDKVYVFSVKNKKHSIDGNKWDRPMRYHWVNFLPTFFSPAETIEFRVHEATVNPNKTFMYMLLCTSILKYAENTRLGLSTKPLTIEQVLSSHLPKEMSSHIQSYLTMRKSNFKTVMGEFKKDWESIENKWLAEDASYVYKSPIENL
jgi:hypothetical protein